MNINFFDNIGLDNTKVLIGILITAVIVYLLRALPIVAVKKKITNRFLNSVLAYIPYGVMASLIVPEVLYSTVPRGGTPTLACIVSALAGIIISVVLAWRNKSLALVIVASIITVFVVAKVLPFIPVFA